MAEGRPGGHGGTKQSPDSLMYFGRLLRFARNDLIKFSAIIFLPFNSPLFFSDRSLETKADTRSILGESRTILIGELVLYSTYTGR